MSYSFILSTYFLFLFCFIFTTPRQYIPVSLTPTMTVQDSENSELNQKCMKWSHLVVTSLCCSINIQALGPLGCLLMPTEGGSTKTPRWPWHTTAVIKGTACRCSSSKYMMLLKLMWRRGNLSMFIFKGASCVCSYTLAMTKITECYNWKTSMILQ